MRITPCAALAVAATLWAGTAAAQSAQYTAPGSSGVADPVTKEEIEQRMAEARWRLGPVRLAPYLGVRGLSWVENVFADEEGGGTSDLTASVGAGLTAYLPTGPSLFWVAQAMPEYVYWADLDQRRQLVGRYGAGLFGDFNRLTLAAEATRLEEQTEVSSEEPEPAMGELDRAGVSAALELTSRLSLTAGGSLAEIANRPGDPDDPRSADFERLDRREERSRAGLRYGGDALTLEAGVERHETDFEDAARDLSTTGTSPYLSLALTGNRVALQAEVTRLSLDPEPGSLLPPVETTEGAVHLGLTPGWRFAIGLYGRRAFIYSFSDLFTHFEETRYGAELSAPFGDRLGVRVFLEAGENDYAGGGLGAPPRLDDAVAFGAIASYRLREWLQYDLGYRRLELDSNLPGFDRDTESVLSTLSLTTGSWIWQ